MDRATRKANLKKLQLPSSSGNKQRKSHQTDKSTATTNTAITRYFLTPKKLKNVEDVTNDINTQPGQTRIKDPSLIDESANTATRSRAKRKKLDAFLFKDPKNIPSSIKKVKKSLNDEDLILPEINIKKAPKLSQTKAKSSKSLKTRKQTAIKTAFLRNEQLFAEIAAQHCAADQFDGDDVQLALAISKSEAENEVVKIADSCNKDVEIEAQNIGDEMETIRDKLKKYGFRTAEKKDYNTFAAAFLPKMNNPRLKSKWANKFTALTLRSSEIQLKKLQHNIQKLLNNQFCSKPSMNREQLLPLYKFQSSLLKKSGAPADKRILKNIVNINQPNELFFVTELFEINQVPAGHLLKDWRRIQGRDLTPNPKDKQTIERTKLLKNIYQDLEEYFSSRKRLDWTTSTEYNDNNEMTTNKGIGQKSESTAKEKTASSTSGIVEEIENEELNGMIELIEHLQTNNECMTENSKTNISTTSEYDEKILKLLPKIKSLEAMNVSSCSINTQATINTTQKNRSSSPDLFADSDIELEENNKTEGTVINLNEDLSRETSADGLTTNITTYEIFSSDEVKKTSLLEQNKFIVKESWPKKSLDCNDCALIDVKQDDLHIDSKTVDNLNQSKSIIEVDLFAESPSLDDENSNSTDINSNEYIQMDKQEDLKFTLNSKATDEKQFNLDRKPPESLKLMPEIKKTKKELEQDDDVALSEILVDQTDSSVLNFEDIEQLEGSFHKKTATIETDIAKYNLAGNDTIFQQLCNKYLNRETNNDSTVAKAAKKGKLSKHSSEIIQTLKTPAQKCNFPLNNTDFGVTDDFNLSCMRKSMSFTIKTPSRLDCKKSKINLTKCQSFNDLNSSFSIDLTQNDDDEAHVTIEENDDCLILSDDEINYSIWQADNTINLKTSEQNTSPEINNSLSSHNTSSSDEDYKSFHKTNIIEFPFNKENEKEFSSLDIEEKENSLIKITLGPQETISDFEILTSKYTSSNAAGQEEDRFDRSEFGILEEYSEAIDFTANLYSPTKILTEASFLNSPAESAEPMKRYSQHRKSLKKFQDLLSEPQTNSPTTDFPEFEDFDDFDNLMFTSPLKSPNSPKKPQGFDQLLKGKISFTESEEPQKLSLEAQVVEYNNKTYKVRYTNSPKPDYIKYSEAELLKQLYNYGIKPLKRKQAVKMLEYIYNQTHPILMENTEEDVITLDDLELPCTSKESLLKSNQSKTKSSDVHVTMFSTESEEEMAVKLPEIVNKTLDLRDGCGLEMLRFPSDLKAELQDEIYILQTNVTKKTPQPLLPFHIAWYNLVCSNIKLHETILMYEPIDLQEIYLFLKSLGYRYDPKDLKLFFDHRCIIFRYDLSAAAAGGNKKLKNSNRHIRKSKKSKTVLIKN